MKRRLLKIAMFVIGVPAGMVLSGFLIYVYLYYPRQAEPFEIKTENPQKRILIATEGSEFKNLLVKNLCDSLQKSSVYIKGVDVGDLKRIDAKHWDRILVINTFMVWPSKNVHRFVDGALDPEKILLMVTSGGADWQPNSDLRIDAFTSASRREHISDLSRLIVGWIGKKNDQKWEPEDYVLLLRYFPRVDWDISSLLPESAAGSPISPAIVSVCKTLSYGTRAKKSCLSSPAYLEWPI